jgi:hypothetical protein
VLRSRAMQTNVILVRCIDSLINHYHFSAFLHFVATLVCTLSYLVGPKNEDCRKIVVTIRFEFQITFSNINTDFAIFNLLEAGKINPLFPRTQ